MNVPQERAAFYFKVLNEFYEPIKSLDNNNNFITNYHAINVLLNNSLVYTVLKSDTKYIEYDAISLINDENAKTQGYANKIFKQFFENKDITKIFFKIESDEKSKFVKIDAIREFLEKLLLSVPKNINKSKALKLKECLESVSKL